ncbi:MAG: hypothetical protein KDK22_19135, partial [Rhodobacteraceae bacterium]|nr:hypothetical protein [Paracoccaceae bacterium]
MQADHFAQIDPPAGGVGAVAIDDLAVEIVIGQRRRSGEGKGGNGQNDPHAPSLARFLSDRNDVGR